MVQFFLPSLSGVYGWVSSTIFWRWTVSEVNWLCRQASQANKQSIYLDVYGVEPPIDVDQNDIKLKIGS